MWELIRRSFPGTAEGLPMIEPTDQALETTIPYTLFFTLTNTIFVEQKYRRTSERVILESFLNQLISHSSSLEFTLPICRTDDQQNRVKYVGCTKKHDAVGSSSIAVAWRRSNCSYTRRVGAFFLHRDFAFLGMRGLWSMDHDGGLSSSSKICWAPSFLVIEGI